MKEIQDLTRQYILTAFSKAAIFWKKSDWHSQYLISEIEVVVSIKTTDSQIWISLLAPEDWVFFTSRNAIFCLCTYTKLLKF